MNEQDYIKHIINQGSDSKQMMAMMQGIFQKITSLSMAAAQMEQNMIQISIVNKSFENMIEMLANTLIEKEIMTKEELEAKRTEVFENTQDFANKVQEEIQAQITKAQEQYKKEQTIEEQEYDSSVVLASERFKKE